MARLDGGDEAAAGIVQHAVLMGLPASADAAKWCRLKRVVAGRLINVTRAEAARTRAQGPPAPHQHTAVAKAPALWHLPRCPHPKTRLTPPRASATVRMTWSSL